jgi:hypothetical protein
LLHIETDKGILTKKVLIQQWKNLQ